MGHVYGWRNPRFFDLIFIKRKIIGKIIIIIIHEIKCDILGERWYHDPFVRIIETKIHGSG